MQLLKVQKLSQPELSQIVNLHYYILEESFINNFGKQFLKTAYKTIVESPNNVTIIALDDDKIIGYMVATLDGDKFNQEVINANFLKLSWYIFKASILHPTLFIKLIQWKLKPAHPNKIKPELQFIAINPTFQGKKIGTKMIKLLNKKFAKKGIKKYRVGTKAQNKLSNRFYKKLGFKSFYKDEFFGDKFNYYLSPNTAK